MTFKVSTVYTGMTLPDDFNGIYANYNEELDLKVNIGETVKVAFKKPLFDAEIWLINLYKRVK